MFPICHTHQARTLSCDSSLTCATRCASRFTSPSPSPPTLTLTSRPKLNPHPCPHPCPHLQGWSLGITLDLNLTLTPSPRPNPNPRPKPKTEPGAPLAPPDLGDGPRGCGVGALRPAEPARPGVDAALACRPPAAAAHVRPRRAVLRERHRVGAHPRLGRRAHVRYGHRAPRLGALP